MSTFLNLFDDDFALFVEVGFIAVKQLDEISAKRLFKAAHCLRPNHPSVQVGLGYIALHALRITEAIATFEAVVQQHPDHELARAMLGVAYMLTPGKRPQGEQIMKELEQALDPTVVNISRVTREWVQQDLQPRTLLKHT